MPRYLRFALFLLCCCNACQPEHDLNLISLPDLMLSANRKSPALAPAEVLPTSNIVFQSSDGGQTWKDISAGLPKKFDAYSVYAGDKELLLGFEGGLFRSSTVSPAWHRDLQLNERIGIIFQGLKGPIAYSYDGGFFEAIPGTDIWMHQDLGPEDRSVWSAIETADGNLLISNQNGIYKSSADRKTWQKVFDEGLVNNLVTLDGELFGSGYKGVIHSTDGGEHWNWMLGDHGRAMQIISSKGGIAVVFSGKDGPWKQVNTAGQEHSAFISTDHGKTWNRVDEGLPVVRNILDIAQAGNALFCSLDTGIYRSEDQGKTWKLVIEAGENTYFKLTVSGQTIYAVKVNKGC